MYREKGDFVTDEVAAECLARSGGQCEHCFSKPVVFHHKKYRSRAPKDSELHSSKNIAVLCVPCHVLTHSGSQEMAQYRTARWQQIGESEADIS